MITRTLLLRETEVARLIGLPRAIRVVRAATMAMARGGATMPPKVYLALPRHSDFRAMPAALTSPATCGMKWVNVHPGNRARGLPTIMALIVLNDPATGWPLAIMDGGWLTTLRTAAASAVAATALARPNSRRVALIGCGAQAPMQLDALMCTFGLTHVTVWGFLPHEAERFCLSARRRHPTLTYTACATVQQAVRHADIVVTITPSRRPLIKREWLSPGVHINAVGADAPGKQELDPAILREGLVVVDDRTQAIHGGELNVPIRRGQFRARDIHATLGELLIGRARGRPTDRHPSALLERPPSGWSRNAGREGVRPRHPASRDPRLGRRTDRALTIFDSTGLATHDIALGDEVVRAARRQGVGHLFAFFTPRTQRAPSTVLTTRPSVHRSALVV